MGKADKKPVIGIIGGMCSGKSTVAGEFAKLGCAVIDADELAHEALKKQDVLKKVVRLFGKEVLDEAGKISRVELAKRVFGDGGQKTEDRGQRTEDRGRRTEDRGQTLLRQRASDFALNQKRFRTTPDKTEGVGPGFASLRRGEQKTEDRMSLLTGILHPPVLARIEQLMAKYMQEPGVRAIVLDMPLLVEVGWEKRCDRVIFIDCKAPLRLERAKKTGLFEADELKIRENLQISLDKKKRIADNIVDNNSDLSGLSKQITCIFSSIVANR